MIRRYKDVSIIYGGSGRTYADALHQKITDLSDRERYPIKSTIINDRILTGDLFKEVVLLFKESEFCVAFLTKDDCVKTDKGEFYRLRQNVVFELGMALIELGRERCILLSDFDISGSDFELPSDMKGVSCKRFNDSNFDTVLDEVIKKLLKFSRYSVMTGVESDEIPRYDHLLTRNEYWIDYENIFVDRPLYLATEGGDFYNDTLKYWTDECDSLPHYDEKCMHILERIGFLPIFGRTEAVTEYLNRVDRFIESYPVSDVKYYGRRDVLEFSKNLVSCVAEYTSVKSGDDPEEEKLRKYKKILSDLKSEDIPDITGVNPLLSVVYYDYCGLVYLKLHDIKNALDYFLKAYELTGNVDLSLQIWAGFLTYNIARAYAELEDVKISEQFYKKAIHIRSRWLKNTKFNLTVRAALSYEYFIAKIGYIDMCSRYGIMNAEEIKGEYKDLQSELNMYSETDEKVGQLLSIKKLLESRMMRIRDLES